MLRSVPRTEAPTIQINMDHKCVLCGKDGATSNRFCLPCTTDAVTFRVPNPGDFYDENNAELDYILAPDLSSIARRLIKTYEEDFEWIFNAEIDFFWKKKGGEKGGRRTIGQCKKVSGTEKYYSKKDFIIWLGADSCFSFDYYKITAAVYHELKHIHFAGTAEVLGHDLEVFAREIEVFGDWKNDIAAVRKSYERSEQLSLFS